MALTHGALVVVTGAPAVEFVGVTKSYRAGSERLVVLDQADLSITAGEIVAVTGPSGSGKSTLLHLAAGLDHADSGSIRLCGETIDGLGANARAALRRRRVGFVFQAFHLLPQLTVRENIALPALLERAMGASELRMRTDELLGRLNLTDQQGQTASQLSGGQRQRVAIGRALFNRPEVIFADEPTGNLDRASGAATIDLLLESVAHLGAALIVATHDSAVADVASRRLHVDGGELTPGGV